MASTKTPDVTIEEADEAGNPLQPEQESPPDGPVVEAEPPAPGAPAVNKPSDFRRRATVPERKAVR